MIKISMRGAAEVAAAAPSRKVATLKKYKQTDSGETKGRSNYYISALSFVTSYHKQGNHPSALTAYLAAMQKKLAEKPNDPRWRAKVLNNMRAAEQYIQHFGQRKFTVCEGKKLAYTHNGVVVSARPDLVIEENGERLLIKLNLGRIEHSSQMAAIQLHFMFTAANAAGLEIGPQQVVYIQPVEGFEHRGPASGFPPDKRLASICSEIEGLWN